MFISCFCYVAYMLIVLRALLLVLVDPHQASQVVSQALRRLAEEVRNA